MDGRAVNAPSGRSFLLVARAGGAGSRRSPSVRSPCDGQEVAGNWMAKRGLLPVGLSFSLRLIATYELPLR